jgi:hypothetical protein
MTERYFDRLPPAQASVDPPVSALQRRPEGRRVGARIGDRRPARAWTRPRPHDGGTFQRWPRAFSPAQPNLRERNKQRTRELIADTAQGRSRSAALVA